MVTLNAINKRFIFIKTYFFILIISLGFSLSLSPSFIHSSPVSNQHDTLIVSNYPEEIYGPGKVFEEIISKNALRVMYYHKNGTTHPLYVKLDLKNLKDYPVSLQVIKGLGGPVDDEIFSGHQSTKRYIEQLLTDDYDTITLAPHERKTLIYHKIKPNLVVAGLTRIVPVNQNTVSVHLSIIDEKKPHLSLLNQVNNGREFSYGFYQNAVKHINIDFDCESVINEIPIGDHPFFVGEKTGIELQGNYGVWYQIKVNLKNKDAYHKKINLYMSPRGGIARGLMIINNTLIETGLFRHSNQLKPRKVYEFSVGPNETKHVKIVTMPQAGSFYPINLVLQTQG